MAMCSKRVPAFHSQDKPPPDCSVPCGSTKLHTSFKSVFLSDEHSSCPPILVRRKHQIGFHPALTERSVERCSTTSSRRFPQGFLSEIPHSHPIPLHKWEGRKKSNSPQRDPSPFLSLIYFNSGFARASGEGRTFLNANSGSLGGTNEGQS